MQTQSTNVNAELSIFNWRIRRASWERWNIVSKKIGHLPCQLVTFMSLVQTGGKHWPTAMQSNRWAHETLVGAHDSNNKGWNTLPKINSKSPWKIDVWEISSFHFLRFLAYFQWVWLLVETGNPEKSWMIWNRPHQLPRAFSKSTPRLERRDPKCITYITTYKLSCGNPRWNNISNIKYLKYLWISLVVTVWFCCRKVGTVNIVFQTNAELMIHWYTPEY